MANPLSTELHRVRNSILPPFIFVLILWLIKFTEIVSGSSFGEWGILPHSVPGLRGILFAPLIHSAEFSHLASNSLPMIVLGSVLLYFYRSIAYWIFILIYLISGLFVWVFAMTPGTYHIGASGVIYGLAAFLFLSGILKKNPALLAVSMLITFLYGGMLWGVLPGEPQISWQSHLGGAISGLGLAFAFRKTNIGSKPPPTEDAEIPEHLWNLDSHNIPPPTLIEFHPLDDNKK